jgi:PadR family transcriptional regulator, regulatory protein PadR
MAGDLLQGTLDLIILRVLDREPLHGWALAERIHEMSEQALRVNQGSLYPALHRLEGRGLIDADWGLAHNGRRVRVYRLTAAGRRQLARETAGWEEYARAIQLILRNA